MSKPQGLVQPEELGKLKKLIRLSGLKPMTFQLVV
jgi:hypothetical protein